jgi:hypothetical protein
MVFLNWPRDQAQVSGSDFIEWAEAHPLQAGQLACGARDLCGARCGLLQTYILRVGSRCQPGARCKSHHSRVPQRWCRGRTVAC